MVVQNYEGEVLFPNPAGESNNSFDIKVTGTDPSNNSCGGDDDVDGDGNDSNVDGGRRSLVALRQDLFSAKPIC